MWRYFQNIIRSEIKQAADECIYYDNFYMKFKKRQNKNYMPFMMTYMGQKREPCKP